MGVLTFQLSSSLVEDAYSNIDIIFNGSTLASNVPLTADSQTFTYNVDIPTGSDNTVGINVLNPLGSGAFDGEVWSDVRVANLLGFSYSLDDSNFNQLLPQIEETYTVNSGVDAGQVWTLSKSIPSFVVYEPGFSFVFNTSEFNGEKIIRYTKIDNPEFDPTTGLPTYITQTNTLMQISSDETQSTIFSGQGVSVYEIATHTLISGPEYSGS
jgi:hypothetical protein